MLDTYSAARVRGEAGHGGNSTRADVTDR